MSAIPSSLIEHAGWVLLHSVWQFATIAALIFVGNRLLKNASASARYMLLLSGLLLVTVAPVATWFVLPKPLDDTMVAMVEPPALPLLDELTPPPIATAQRDPAFEYSTDTPSGIVDLPSIPPAIAIENVSAVKWYERLTDVLQPWLSTIVVLWCVGVLLFSVRPVVGWLNVRRLRMVGTSPVTENVQQALQSIAERLRVNRQVEILASTVVTSPIVVGCFRSVILLPASFIANVPATQLEAILAHELAHVRRYDYLINLLQTLVETLFFYHPAVWWLSHRIRIERENCCDDLVVATFANNADYGRALLAVEEFRNKAVPPSTLALGAQGGSLLDRVRRLLKPPEQDRRAGSAGAVALTVLTIGLLVVGFWASAETQADDEAVTESAHPDSLMVDIADGISLELLAVHPHNDRTKAWHPNGLPYEGSADLREWTDTAHQFPETARHLMFRWTGLRNRSTRSKYKIEGLPRGKRMYFPPGKSGIARLITNSAVGQDVLSVQVGLADSNWGPWVRVNKDGEVVASMKIPPECQDAYALISSCSIEDQGRQSWFCWLGEDQVSDSAQYKIVAVMKDGNRCDYDAGTSRGDSPNLESIEIFDVPLSQIDHFEYRLRPYRHWVTFENVARQPGVKTDVRVSVESIPIPRPDSYVAKFPGGQSIEFVGMTNNNEPASEGWKPDGRRLQAGVGTWNSDVLLGGNARDFLFRLDGLKTVPSLCFCLPGRGAHFSYMQPDQLPGPWKLRVGGSLGDESRFEGGYFRQEAGVVQVAMTDEPWGKWLQISATDAEILNPLAETDKFTEAYNAVQIRRVESLRATSDPRDLPAGLGLTLYRSQQHALGHGFRVRGIDSAGEEVWLVPTSDRREVDGKSAYPVERTWRMYKPLPEGRSLSHFEFRLRPYRHLVTFENVVTEGPRDEPSEVKVSVKTLADPVAVNGSSTSQVLRLLRKSNAIADLKKLLVENSATDFEPINLLSDRRRGAGAGDGGPVKSIQTPGGFLYVAIAAVRPLKDVAFAHHVDLLRPEDLRYPEAAFVFDATGKLLATLGGEHHHARSRFDSDDVDVVCLGPEEDWFVRVMNFQYDAEPFKYRTTWYRLTNPVIKSVRILNFPNQMSWSDLGTGFYRWGNVTFGDPKRRYGPSWKLTGQDDTNVEHQAKIVWDGDRNRFIGPRTLQTHSQPLFQVDTDWSREFDALQLEPKQIAVHGGARSEHWHTWQFVVPKGQSSSCDLSFATPDGVIQTIQKKLKAGYHTIELQLLPKPTAGRLPKEISIQNTEETYSGVQLTEQIDRLKTDGLAKRTAITTLRQRLVQLGLHLPEPAVDSTFNDLSDLNSRRTDSVVQNQQIVDRLTKDVAAMRKEIVALRKQLTSQEDFQIPDGFITSVDLTHMVCHVNIGEEDGLRPGISFSVYTRTNPVAGRTREVKGKIRIVEILGPHRARGQIINHQAAHPITADDFVSSPIYQSDESPKVAFPGTVFGDGDAIKMRFKIDGEKTRTWMVAPADDLPILAPVVNIVSPGQTLTLVNQPLDGADASLKLSLTLPEDN